MCAIAGVFWFDARHAMEDPGAAAERALGLLERRGPDEAAVTRLGDGVAGGANRLIVRGARGIGSVPFVDDACTLFYNGEVYNYRSFSPEAATDGSVIIPLFRRYGPAGFALLDGEFAAALWDGRTETLVLARDAFGSRPLYFSLDARRLIWGSSESAINTIDPHPLSVTVRGPLYAHTLSPQEPFTSYRGVWTVPPGHCLAVTRRDASLVRFHSWSEAAMSSYDVDETFSALTESLERRLEYEGTIGIAMSAGVDSGVIAFAADYLGVRYRIYSVTKMFGEPTVESDAICRRADRLHNAEAIRLLDCDEAAYEEAVSTMFAHDYYASERLDDGNVPLHTVMSAMAADGIRVAIDGTGGDELFHGYGFADAASPVPGWPRPWRAAASRPYYTLFSTLLDFTAKSDRAGGHYSIETRFPYQNVRLAHAAMRLRRRSVTKWPLREYLLTRLSYGAPLPLDLQGKVGFSIKHRSREATSDDLRRSWSQFAGPSRPVHPAPFPFAKTLAT